MESHIFKLLETVYEILKPKYLRHLLERLNYQFNEDEKKNQRQIIQEVQQRKVLEESFLPQVILSLNRIFLSLHSLKQPVCKEP